MAKKLEEIKEEECPYELPEGWKWERLGNVAEVVSGGTPSSKVKEYYNGDIAWITPADLSGYKKRYISRGAKNITKTGLDKSSAKLMPKDTVLLSSRAPIGYVVIAKNELSTNQGFKNFLPSDDYLPQYLYWYLKGNKELLESYASGTTFLELSASKAKMIEFPLAPKETQQKIVDIIDSLFAKLDIAQEKVEQVLAESDNRRSAILHNAFSGKLTEKWRKENGVSFDTWKNVDLNKCSNVISGNAFNSKEFVDEGVPCIKITNVGVKEYISKDVSYLPISAVDSNSKFIVEFGDILISLTRSYINAGLKVCVYDSDDVALLNQRVAMVKKCENSNYIYYFLQTNEVLKYVKESCKFTNQPNLSIKDLNALKIYLPTRSEQKEIVSRLDKFLSVEDKVKSTCQNILETIATMRKSILAKAFRGELCS